MDFEALVDFSGFLRMTGCPVLKGKDDYFTWTRAVREFLLDTRPLYWDAIQQEKVVNVLESQDIAPTDWREEAHYASNNGGAVGFLLRHISTSILQRVNEASNAHDLWERLKTLYGQKNFTEAQDIPAKLSRLAHDSTVQQFIDALYSTAKDLEMHGEPQSDETLLICFLRGLRPEARIYVLFADRKLEKLGRLREAGEKIDDKITHLWQQVMEHALLYDKLANSTASRSKPLTSSQRTSSKQSRSGFRPSRGRVDVSRGRPEMK